MKALGRNIVIEPMPEKVGSIFIPNKKNAHRRGRVLSIGEVKGSEVAVGDVVVYDCSGSTTDDDGNEVIRYSNVLFIYE